jgi:hypothetical protein
MTESKPPRARVAGSGMAAGAGLCLIAGTLLSADVTLMTVLGAVAGLLIGAAVDLQRSR